jgi:hypothetical protein
VTRNNNAGLLSRDWNEISVKYFSIINWRASLVPAAAVIPAPVAYIKVVAVKKLVVEALLSRLGDSGFWAVVASIWVTAMALSCCGRDQVFYLEQIKVFQAGFGLNSPAWNNRKGLCVNIGVLACSND